MLRALLILLAAAAWASPPDVDFRDRAGKSTAEAIKWYASGTVPGTLGVRTDTLIGDTNKNDTTLAVDVAGAERVSVTLYTRRKSANTTNVLVSYWAQVADSSAKTAVWHTISSHVDAAVTNDMVYSVASSTGDTLMWVLVNPAYPDTLNLDVTGGVAGGVTVCTHAGQSMFRTSRFFRLVADPTSYAGDTVLSNGVITKTYPR
uniref:Uncharacterized protein n=1 Tax=viral metagenome TaxID=1070528 RepID=A0A6M3XFC9_9ZZZZ